MKGQPVKNLNRPLLPGWTRVSDAYPNIGETVEILQFGNGPKVNWVTGTASVDDYGICPRATDGHCKRSTVTHWRKTHEHQD